MREAGGWSRFRPAPPSEGGPPATLSDTDAVKSALQEEGIVDEVVKDELAAKAPSPMVVDLTADSSTPPPEESPSPMPLG